MSAWYGPKPKIPTGPKHPTPWTSARNQIFDANGNEVIELEGHNTFSSQDAELAEILRDAVNARALAPVEATDQTKYYRKLKKDDNPSRGTHAWQYYNQRPGQVLQKLSESHVAWHDSFLWDTAQEMITDSPDRTIEEIDWGLLPGLAPDTE